MSEQIYANALLHDDIATVAVIAKNIGDRRYAAMGDTHKRYRLDMEHNNWWECFVYTPEGEFHDMMWALDSDHIFEGVEVVLSAMDSVIEDITENKERIEYGKDSAFYC